MSMVESRVGHDGKWVDEGWNKRENSSLYNFLCIF